MDNNAATTTVPGVPFYDRSIDRRFFLRVLGGAAICSLCHCQPKKRVFAPIQGDTSAERAVNAAKRFAGTSLNVGWETGLQAQGLARFAIPLWQELTGMRINIVEMGWPLDQFRRIIAEHRAGASSLDCASIVPSWIPDLLADRALEPLDEYAAHYLVSSDFDDYLPLYRTLGFSEGRQYGFFDDGDTLLLYYRQDLFDDVSQQNEFAARYGRPLGDPRTYNWRQFIDVARFFTERYAPDLYGLAPLTRELCWACFANRLRVEGGQFFDRNSMKSDVNSSHGRRALTQVLEMIQVMVPMGMMEIVLSTSMASFLSGKAAMSIFWPPLGRSADQKIQRNSISNILPKSQVAGKTRYALLPDGISEMAVGFVLSVLASSQKKEAAYLFIQWLSSPEISLQRVEHLGSLRDPYRFSHIHAPELRTLWEHAGDYLDTLEKAASGKALLDLMIPGAPKYQESFYEILINIRLGATIDSALKQLAQSWDQITDGLGRRRQRQAYIDYLKRPGALMPRPAADGNGSTIR